jgi:hypothetical protein
MNPSACQISYDVPTSRETLLASLGQVDDQIAALWRSITADEFFVFPPNGGWSPAENLAHLVTATGQVTLALRLPRIVPRLLFGRSRAASRGFSEIRDTYRKALTAGAQAGKFTPERRPLPADVASARDKLIDKWQPVVPSLCRAIRRCDDRTLDAYQLPHPILGKLTFREMLYFTLYHLGHHASIVAARQGGH